MFDGVAVAIVVAGLVLLFSGAALSVYGVVGLGLVIGGGGGYVLGPTLGTAMGLEGAAAAGAPIVVGALAGGLLGYALLSAAVALIGFVVGGLFAMAALEPTALGQQWFLAWPVAIVVGLVVAFLGALFQRWTIAGLTAVVGAALASRSLTIEQFTATQGSLTLEPLLFDVTSPPFLALVALGVLSQFGLVRLGHATSLVRLLPGSAALRRRREEPEPAEAAR
jgi:hypothetical protein